MLMKDLTIRKRMTCLHALHLARTSPSLIWCCKHFTCIEYHHVCGCEVCTHLHMFISLFLSASLAFSPGRTRHAMEDDALDSESLDVRHTRRTSGASAHEKEELPGQQAPPCRFVAQRTEFAPHRTGGQRRLHRPRRLTTVVSLNVTSGKPSRFGESHITCRRFSF